MRAQSFFRITVQLIGPSTRLWAGLVGVPFLTFNLSAQLAITEVMSSASTNLGSTLVTQASDFWELTNFGTNDVNLNDGYRWNDNAGEFLGADTFPFVGLTIAAGESIIFIETNNPVMTTAEAFRTWWNLPTSQKVVVYIGNGLSSAGDGVRLWDGSGRLVDSVDFGPAERGRSFAYDPATGLFGLLSTNGVGGAFKAVTADDVGSPGATTGPVPAQILTHPASQKVNPGDTVTFTVVAGGLPRPRFQWYFNNEPIPDATTATLVVTNVQNAAVGDYRVAVDNGVTSQFSSTASLTLNPLPEPPQWVTAPRAKRAFVGQNVTFVSLASGTPQPSYQWYLDGNLLAGRTEPSLTLSGLSLLDAGAYTVVASNPLGAVTNGATLSVTRRPRLVITEILAAQSTNALSNGHNDWWELTNLDDFTVDLSGYRFDDGSATLAAAVTFTNATLNIAPGESIVFVENMTTEAFRSWWGVDNLPAGLQIISYRGTGLGLSSLGDAINLWNSAATEDFDTITSEVFSTVTIGVSFTYDPDIQTFGGNAQNGVLGAFVSRESGDVGSPGYIRNPPNPRLLGISRSSAGWRLTWTSIPGRNYSLQSTADPGASAWVTLNTFPASDSTQTFTDTTDSVERRFYRVVLEP